MMMNYNQVKATLVGTTESENKVISIEDYRNNSTAYNTVLSNCQKIGGKRFCCIPLDLLEVDEDYQRVHCINMKKVYSLVNKWDFNKFDPILVSPHPETNSFSVIDGFHRMLASGIRKESYVLAVLTEGLSENLSERKMQEARLFASQGEEVDKLDRYQKHKAYVTLGVKKYCILDNCIKGRKLLLSIHELKNLPQEQQDALKAADYKILTGYAAAVQVAALVNGEETLTNIFDIIEKSGWHQSANGYSKNVISSIKSVLNMHDNDPRVIKAIISFFKPIDPNIYFAEAHVKYPKRFSLERLVMYLEEEVSKRLGVQPLYTGGDLRKITSVLNAQRHHVSSN